MNTINTRTLVDAGVDISYPIWHPYSNINRNYYNLTSMVKGEGIYLYDINGKEYLDASSGLWNISLGYGNKKIMDSIKRQMEQLPYCSLFDHTNPLAVLAASSILDKLPEYMKKIFFTCSGSESIELAMKVMRKFWQLEGRPEKNTIISLEGSYHGTYYGSISVSGIEREYSKDFGPLPGNIVFFETRKCKNCSEGKQYPNCSTSCAGEMEDFIKANADKIAGIMLEPILSSKGVVILPERYIKHLGYLCNKYQILLAVDEVAVGFYRTGTAFYIEKIGIQPDILCMGKGINSGYLPLGATAFNDRITETFSGYNDYLAHGSTQGGNLLACAACAAAMPQYEELNASKNISEMGSYFINVLKEQLSYHRNVGEIRGVGFLAEIDLIRSSDRNRFLSVEKIVLVQERLKRNGLIVYRSETGLTVLPMLIAEKCDIDLMADIVRETMKELIFN